MKTDPIKIYNIIMYLRFDHKRTAAAESIEYLFIVINNIIYPVRFVVSRGGL